MTAGDIHSKIDLARANFDKLRQIPQKSLEEFAGDFRNQDSALRRLQTTIQTIIDIGSWIIAAKGLPAPATSRDVLGRLASAGILPRDAEERWGPIIGFRNRIVHAYDDIDPAIVFGILRSGTGELREVLDLLVAAAAALDT